MHELLENQENKTLNSFGYVSEVEKTMKGQEVAYSSYFSKEQYTAVRLYETREREREKQETQIASEREIK